MEHTVAVADRSLLITVAVTARLYSSPEHTVSFLENHLITKHSHYTCYWLTPLSAALNRPGYLALNW